MNVKITTLIENNADDNGILFNEHGLSFYIEIDEVKILFDTGKSGDFIKNASLLKIDLNKLDYIMISHGHYDHSGGFIKLVDNVENAFKIIIGEGFFNKKYKLLEENTYKYLGNSFDEQYINQKNIPIKYIKEHVFYINENIMIFSNFEKSNDFEMLNKKFYLKKDGNYILDHFSDEIVLGIKTKKGLVVILGCSHIGVVNILETIIKRTGMPIYGIIGGTHLIEADEQRLKNTIKFFKEKDIQVLGLSHCTGECAIEEIKQQFGERFLYNNTGNVIEFGDSLI